jgi:type IV secretory pathway TrbD component
MAVAGIIGIIVYFIFLLGILGLWIYGFILFVKLAKRGIKALDIYIDGKTTQKPSDHYID